MNTPIARVPTAQSNVVSTPISTPLPDPLPSPHITARSALAQARASADYAQKLTETQALLRQAAYQHAGRMIQASSLGAEDVVITHIIDALGLDIPAFVLDTGKLHAPTLDLLARQRQTNLAAQRIPIAVYTPDPAAAAKFEAREGADAMYRSIELRKACCAIRKTAPLALALAGKTAWITGLRREQSQARADVPLIDTSEPRTKFNPLAAWTWGDVWHYIAQHGVDYNALHDEFYPSIGCAPCTRAITLGEDFRSGRWWWEEETAKECGLHVKPDATVVATLDVSRNQNASAHPPSAIKG